MNVLAAKRARFVHPFPSYRPLQDEPEIYIQKSTYTTESEAEDDSTQGTSPRKVTGLHETTQRQGGLGKLVGRAATAKSLPKGKVKPGKERPQTAPSRLRSEPKSSISGFTFTTNGAGSIHNQNVGVIRR